MEAIKHVVWRWGDRWVNFGRLISEDENVAILIFTSKVTGEEHHLVIPKGSFTLKYFNSKEEAENFLGEQKKGVH